MSRRSLPVSVARLLLAAPLLAPPAALRAADTGPVVRVAYFVPADRRPEPDYRARLGRVMDHVRDFFRAGMADRGYGRLTFDLDRGADGALRVREVRGRRPSREYGRDGADRVRAEVAEAFARDGLDINRQTVVIFQVLLEWRDGRAVEVGPYVGGGGPRGGTAWVYDDAKLDPRLLGSRGPGGYYNGPCSLGEFNTHYLGGVAHELGHALGLPHDRETDADRPRLGASLMGGGNHAYGQERRGAGRGAFLSPASALPLSVHPLFTGRPVPAETYRIAELRAAHEGGRLVLTGRLAGGRAAGLVARNDPVAPAGDYDAVGWTCAAAADGTFRLAVRDLVPGEFVLRLAAYSASGDADGSDIRYRVDADGRPDLRPFEAVAAELALRLPAALTPELRRRNLLTGGTFESSAGRWEAQSYRRAADAAAPSADRAWEGRRALRLRSDDPAGDDIAFTQRVAVRPGTRYLLAGRVRTEGVTIVQPGGTRGATLGVLGGASGESLAGDGDWAYVALVFDSGDRTEVRVGPRLGHHGSVARGTAWFDDLVMVELPPAAR